MLGIILNFGLSNFTNVFGVAIAGSYTLFGFFILAMVAMLLFLLNIPETIILGTLSVLVVILHALWGGVFTTLATIVGVVYAVMAAIFMFSLFRRGD